MKITKDLKILFLAGLPFLLGGLTEDFCIRYYLHEGDSPLDFGIFAEKLFTNEQFFELVNSKNKERYAEELYRQYLNENRYIWDEDNKVDSERPLINTIDELKVYLSERASRMRKRWALEKKENGGFDLMDHFTLNPGAFDRFIGPRIENEVTYTPEEAKARMREIFGENDE